MSHTDKIAPKPIDKPAAMTLELAINGFIKLNIEIEIEAKASIYLKLEIKRLQMEHLKQLNQEGSYERYAHA